MNSIYVYTHAHTVSLAVTSLLVLFVCHCAPSGQSCRRRCALLAFPLCIYGSCPLDCASQLLPSWLARLLKWRHLRLLFFIYYFLFFILFSFSLCNCRHQNCLFQPFTFLDLFVGSRHSSFLASVSPLSLRFNVTYALRRLAGTSDIVL